jgi:NTP-dependent ternary system trypsin peptidase co-occuring protein
VSDDDITVKDLIQKISDDLLASERERVADTRRAVFEVAELTIELSFVATRSRQGRGGVDLKVISSGGELAREDARTQRMTLRLVAARDNPVQLDEAGDDFAPLDYDRALPVRPRLRGRD